MRVPAVMTYWAFETVEASVPGKLEYTSSSWLGRLAKKPKPGDQVFVVSERDRRMMLVGTLIVAELLNTGEAMAKHPKRPLWPDSNWHVFAQPPYGALHSDLEVPEGVARAIRNLADDALALDPRRYELRPMALNASRWITDRSAALLDRLLAQDRPPRRGLRDQATARTTAKRVERHGPSGETKRSLPAGPVEEFRISWPSDAMTPGGWRKFAEETTRDMVERIASRSRTGRANASAHKGPDIVLGGEGGDPPLAIEVKTWRYQPKNIGNRIAEALSSSVLLRREFPGGVQLTLLAILMMEPGERGHHSTREHRARIESLSSLVRSARDDAGFERVVVGLSSPAIEWVEVDANGVVKQLRGLSDVIASLERPRPHEAFSQDESREVGAPHAGERVPRPARDASPRVLLVADEWWSRRGGISTFNRELAGAFADAGCSVHVVVPQAEEDERDQAKERGVTLVTPDPIPGVDGHRLLLTRPRFSESGYYPAVIVGHGRILGPYAYAARNLLFTTAKRLHIVHMDAERLEMAKEQPPGRSAVLTAEARARLEVELSISADLVAGVGPLLTETIKDGMRGFRQKAPPVVELRPGLCDWGGTVDPNDPPARRQILLIARAEDIRSKGIDIAARAVADAIGRFDNRNGDEPRLVVRGVPEGEADEIKARIDKLVAPTTSVVARSYTTDREVLRQDLWQSRVLIMPSRHEGFGLVAHEAIAAGVPVLISRESGLGRMLRETLTDGDRPEPREVVRVSLDDNEATRVWGKAIYEQLVDPHAAFSRAAKLRGQVSSAMSWGETVKLLLENLGL